MHLDNQDSQQPDSDHDGTRKNWLDERRNVDLICYVLYATCAVLALLDLLYEKHPTCDCTETVIQNWEQWFNFYGFFGFIACVCLVLAAKQMRKVLKREEDYYDR